MARVDVPGAGPAPPPMNAIDAARILSAVGRHRRASRDQLVRFPEGHLRRLIVHAHDRVPCYRAPFDRLGIGPERIRTIADLPLIPVTAQRDLQRASADEVVARGLVVVGGGLTPSGCLRPR